MSRSRQQQRAMALLTEILIALSLLIPVLVMVGAMFPYSYGVDRRAWNERTASSLARSALEKVRSQSFENMTSESWVWPEAGAALEQLSSGGTRFSVQVIVLPDGPVDDSVQMRSLRSVVTWQGKNRQEIFEAETRVARVYQRLR